MSIENMFGDLDKIDILAETKTGEVVMVLVCNGFIDGSPETQKALLDKMEGYLNHTQSEEFQKEYGGWPVICLLYTSLDWPVTEEERNSDKGWGRFGKEQICRLKIRRMKEEWAKDLVVQPWCCLLYTSRCV